MIDKPALIPKSPAGAVVAGGTLTGLLAALGWVGSTLLDLEQTVTRAGDRYESMHERIYAIDQSIDQLQERLVIIEQAVLKDG